MVGLVVGLLRLLFGLVVSAVLPAAGPFGLALVTNLIAQGAQVQAARHTGYLYAANNRCGDWGFAAWRAESGERDTREASGDSPREDSAATRGRRARHKGGSVHDTQAAGAAERGSDAAAEGQSGTIGTGDGGSVLAQHTTTGCALTAHAPAYTIRHASAHWMASSSVHSAKGHIDAVHCVSQSSHNGPLTSSIS